MFFNKLAKPSDIVLKIMAIVNLIIGFTLISALYMGSIFYLGFATMADVTKSPDTTFLIYIALLSAIYIAIGIYGIVIIFSKTEKRSKAKINYLYSLAIGAGVGIIFSIVAMSWFSVLLYSILMVLIVASIKDNKIKSPDFKLNKPWLFVKITILQTFLFISFMITPFFIASYLNLAGNTYDAVDKRADIVITETAAKTIYQDAYTASLFDNKKINGEYITTAWKDFKNGQKTNKDKFNFNPSTRELSYKGNKIYICDQGVTLKTCSPS